MAGAGDKVNPNCCSVWEPYKTLQARIEGALLYHDPDLLSGLVQLVDSQRGNFSSVLKWPARNAAQRDGLQKADQEEVNVLGSQTGMKFPRAFIQDVLKVSDALQLNEMRAAELLIRAELQMPSLSGLSLPSVGVMLFYDGQLALVTALNHLVHAVKGRSWTSNLSNDLQTKITDVMKKMMVTEDLLGHLLNSMKTFDPLKVIDELQKSSLLGFSRKHQKSIVQLIYDIELKLAETVFYWFAQMPAKRIHVISLYGLIGLKCSTTASGYLNKTGSVLLLALLSALDLNYLQEGSHSGTPLPLSLVVSPDIAPRLHEALCDNNITFQVPAVKGIVQFALAVAVKAYQLLTPNGGIANEITTLIDQNERILDDALKSNVFRTMFDLLGPPENLIHTDVFYMKTLHHLITDFIVQQPLMVKKIRLVADEVGRTTMSYQNDHGVNPPESPHDFELLLEFLSRLYLNTEARVPDFAHHMIDEFWTQEISGLACRVSPRLVALYNFVTLYKDYHQILPFNMYVPYCRMLSTLCQSPKAASACFNLLKGQHGPVTVSLEHIFNILCTLHQRLRNDAPLSAQPVTLSSMECAGLEAALGMLASVLGHSESARVTLADHPAYNPLMLFVGLLGCSIPTHLKAACIDVLTKFAASPENALKIWQFVEAAKLVPVTSYVNVNPQPGMQTDLEEVESKNGLYPVTVAFLRLLDVLTDSPLPIIVGSSVFKSGFDPYMNYLRESVFLKFLNRSYNSPAERWIIGSLCLRVMEKILRKFSCISDNLLFNDMTCPIVKPCSENGGQLAFNLLAHLLQNGQLLRLILKIIDEGATVVDIEDSTSEKEDLEKCILLSLKILQQALIQQNHFLCEVRNSNAALIVTALDHLLTGINPRTGKPDYTVTIARFVGYFATLPRQSLAATRVLFLLTRNCKLAEHLAQSFDQDQETARLILTGFSSALDLTMYEEPSPGKEECWNNGQVRTAIAQTILRMIQQCIEVHRTPTVAHFLLGFNLKRAISKANLERPGIMDTPKNCLHTTLELLELSSTCASQISESLTELCFKLVYSLCANPQTNEPVMRYLRTSDNFFLAHLTNFPLQKRPSGAEVGTSTAKILLQQCWLLKGLALELRLTAEQNQRSMLRKLVDQLVVSIGVVGTGRNQPLRRKLLTILDGIVNTNMADLRPPEFIHFDPREVKALIEVCQYNESEEGPVQVDISALHDRLMLERLTEAATISGHMGNINHEIGQIVKVAVMENSKRKYQHARKSCLTAWREVTEVLVSTCHNDIFGGEAKMRFLLDVTMELLTLICEDRKVRDAQSPLTEVVLINMMSLNKLLIQYSQCRATDAASNGYIAVNAYAGQLLTILRHVIDCLHRIGTNMQLARSNLYGALLNILRIVKFTPAQDSSKQSIGERVLSNNAEYEGLQRSLMEIMGSYGEHLMEVICRDFCSGHHIIRMLALSTITIILSIDDTESWLEHVVRKGYLVHITDSVVQDDREIQLILAKGAQDDRPIYVLGAKLSVLQRIAQTERGARMLLDSGLINKLTEFGSLQLRPVSYPVGQPNRVSSGVQESYHRVYNPIMQLLCAISSAVKCYNQDCLTQLHNFLIAHSDVILVVLQQRPPDDVDERALLEICLACKVVSRLGSHEDMHQGRIKKIHEIMLSALPWAVHLRPKQQALEVIRLELIEAILHSCVNFLVPTMYDRKACYLLFSPNLLASDSHFGQSSQPSVSPLRLGLLVQALQDLASELQSVSETKIKRSQMLQKVHELSALELRDLLPEEYRGDTIDTGIQKGLVRETLAKETDTLKKQMELLSSVIEQSMFVLWRHLEFFLTQYVPIQETTLEQLTRSANMDTSLHGGSSAHATNEEVETLRASVGTIFSDAYFRKILQIEGIVDAEQNKQKVLGALVRRVKTLARAK